MPGMKPCRTVAGAVRLGRFAVLAGAMTVIGVIADLAPVSLWDNDVIE